jgi:hypothetical protein
MPKRKQSKPEKRPSPKRAAGKAAEARRTKRRKQAARSSASPSGPDSAVTPAPALPSRRGKRERATRGGKSTLSTHELLAEVLPQPAPPVQAQSLSLTQIYETLAALLVPYARRMESEMHPKIGFCLKARSARTGRETHFGGVQILGDVVAYHLFPLYAHPDLLESTSPELASRMRSSTCFHFQSLHAGLVAELAELTHSGFERFVADGVL